MGGLGCDSRGSDRLGLVRFWTGGCRRESRIHRYTLYASSMPAPLKWAMALCRVTGLDDQVGGAPPSGAGVFNFGQGKDNLNVTLSAPAVCKCLGLAVVDSLWDFDDDPSLTEGDSLKLWAVTRTFSHLAEAKCGLRWVSRRSRTTERDLIPCLCGTIITWDGTFVYADHNVTQELSDITSKIRLPPVKM